MLVTRGFLPCSLPHNNRQIIQENLWDQGMEMCVSYIRLLGTVSGALVGEREKEGGGDLLAMG